MDGTEPYVVVSRQTEARFSRASQFTKNTVMRASNHRCILAIFLIILIYTKLRFSAFFLTYSHTDEIITISIVDGLRSSDSWSTNWANFDLPPMFKYDQLNFSSYFIFLHFIDSLLVPFSNGISLSGIRVVSWALICGSIVLTYTITRGVYGRSAGLCAAALLGINSQIFHDSLYARPEPFFTFVTLGVTQLSLHTPRCWRRLIVASFGAGLMVACKISALPFVMLPALCFVLRGTPIAWPTLMKTAALSIPASFVGFLAGVPHAVVQPNAFVNGFNVLMNQYSTGISPSSQLGMTISEKISYIYLYSGSIFGWICLFFALFGLIVLIKNRNFLFSFIILSATLFILYSGSRTLFHERNFSHCVPFILIAAGVGISALVNQIFAQRRVRWAAAAALMLLSMHAPFQVTRSVAADVLPGGFSRRVEAMRHAVQSEYSGLEYVIWPNLTYGDPMGGLQQHLSDRRRPLLIELWDHDDVHSRSFLKQFVETYGAVRLTTLESPFRSIPPSGLQLYLALTHHVYLLGDDATR